MDLNDFVIFILIGLASGFAGTAAMTLFQVIEIAVTGREPSFAPAMGAAKILGINFEALDPDRKAILNNFTHWGYGTFWGILFPFIALVSQNTAAALIAYAVFMWLLGIIVLSILGIDGPFWRWRFLQNVLGVLHHALYALATGGTAYFLLDFFL